MLRTQSNSSNGGTGLPVGISPPAAHWILSCRHCRDHPHRQRQQHEAAYAGSATRVLPQGLKATVQRSSSPPVPSNRAGRVGADTSSPPGLGDKARRVTTHLPRRHPTGACEEKKKKRKPALPPLPLLLPRRLLRPFYSPPSPPVWGANVRLPPYLLKPM